MMSEYYDHYHRWEPLAEFHFNINSDEEEFDDDNYLYCLCSRAFIRDNIKTYYGDKEEGSESDVEVLRDSHSQEWDDHSHVHFSLDTSYKVKCEKDEGASCYCSASHTDNCCSTDEQDPALHHGTISHALQPSDSGADLTYQDCHSDYTSHDRITDFQFTETNEDYLSESTWDRFWALHGERIIWASWIKNYSDYINPDYLNENKELSLDENNIPKQHSAEPICQEYTDNQKIEDEFRERKFSYDSKVNPYKKNRVHVEEKIEKNTESNNKDEQWLPIRRRRSCSEQDRILSPRTVDGTDSMTNVTKITLSSYDVTSSHVTSESTPTDGYSVSSSPSDNQSNDQTRISNIEDGTEQISLEEMDTEQYWQYLWKKHFGEQYALHCASYIEQHSIKNKEELPAISIEIIPQKDIVEKVIDIDCENSEGNSTDMPTVIENQLEVAQNKVEVKINKKKRNKKDNHRYIDSVGVLLQNLLKEEQKKNEEAIFEAKDNGEGTDNKNDSEPASNEVVETNTSNTNIQQPIINNDFTSYSYDGGDDDPPEESPITLKRSHELDDEEIVSEKIKSTFEIMGFCVHPDKMPKGQLVYRKRLARLRPPRYKKNTPKKTYFDDDGNPYQTDQYKDSQDEREIQTDDECQESKSGSTNDKLKGIDNTQSQMSNKVIDKESDNINDAESAQSSENGVSMSEVSDLVTNNEQNDKDILFNEQKNKLEDKFVNENAILTKEDIFKRAADLPLPCDTETKLNDVNEYDRQKTEESLEAGPQQESTKRRRRQKRHLKVEEEYTDLSELPPELRDDPKMLKYWKKRHSLFHRFDEGIKLDRESWFSVTPENVARHIATKCSYDTVLDAFCGAGGNTIQFARTCKKVIAVDIDPAKIEMAKHNAAVYGVADRIEFIVGDFFEIAHTLSADMVFLSPPWGGPGYSANDQYDLETMLEPKPASQLINMAKDISPTIALYLPRNTRPDQILSLAKGLGGSVEVEQSFLDKRFVAITAYFY